MGALDANYPDLPATDSGAPTHNSSAGTAPSFQPGFNTASKARYDLNQFSLGLGYKVNLKVRILALDVVRVRAIGLPAT